MHLDQLSIVKPPSTTEVGRRIMHAASELFYAQGITATGVDLICERAETTKRTLYQRFGSKDGLIAAYLTARAHAWQTRLMKALRVHHGIARVRASDRVAALDLVFSEAKKWARANPRGCAFVNAWGELADHTGATAEVIRAEKAWMRALFAEIVAAPDLALAVHQVYEGAQVCSTIDGSLAPFDRARTTCRLLLTKR